jgi:hypothetical protein
VNHRTLKFACLTLLCATLPAAAETAAPPKLVIESPVDGQTQQGAIVVKFHTENITLTPAYDDDALHHVPALGHLHVYLDGASWFWIHADAGPIVIAGLPAGPHTVKIELAKPNHVVLQTQMFKVTMAGP